MLENRKNRQIKEKNNKWELYIPSIPKNSLFIHFLDSRRPLKKANSLFNRIQGTASSTSFLNNQKFSSKKKFFSVFKFPFTAQNANCPLLLRVHNGHLLFYCFPSRMCQKWSRKCNCMLPEWIQTRWGIFIIKKNQKIYFFCK